MTEEREDPALPSDKVRLYTAPLSDDPQADLEYASLLNRMGRVATGVFYESMHLAVAEGMPIADAQKPCDGKRPGARYCNSGREARLVAPVRPD